MQCFFNYYMLLKAHMLYSGYTKPVHTTMMAKEGLMDTGLRGNV